MFSHAASEIGLSIAGEGPPQELGARVVGAALMAAFRQVQDVAALSS